MLCAICGREGRGFCWVSPPRPGVKRQFKRFCSRRCQQLHAQGVPDMVDPTENEQAAMVAVLPLLGEYVASVGMDKPLATYSRDEILQLVDVVVSAYFDHLRAITPDDVPF